MPSPLSMDCKFCSVGDASLGNTFVVTHSCLSDAGKGRQLAPLPAGAIEWRERECHSKHRRNVAQRWSFAEKMGSKAHSPHSASAVGGASAVRFSTSHIPPCPLCSFVSQSGPRACCVHARHCSRHIQTIFVDCSVFHPEKSPLRQPFFTFCGEN